MKPSFQKDEPRPAAPGGWTTVIKPKTGWFDIDFRDLWLTAT